MSNAQHKKGKMEDNEGIQFQNKNLIKSLPIEKNNEYLGIFAKHCKHCQMMLIDYT